MQQISITEFSEIRENFKLVAGIHCVAVIPQGR